MSNQIPEEIKEDKFILPEDDLKKMFGVISADVEYQDAGELDPKILKIVDEIEEGFLEGKAYSEIDNRMLHEEIYKCVMRDQLMLKECVGVDSLCPTLNGSVEDFFSGKVLKSKPTKGPKWLQSPTITWDSKRSLISYSQTAQSIYCPNGAMQKASLSQKFKDKLHERFKHADFKKTTKSKFMDSQDPDCVVFKRKMAMYYEQQTVIPTYKSSKPRNSNINYLDLVCQEQYLLPGISELLLSVGVQVSEKNNCFKYFMNRFVLLLELQIMAKRAQSFKKHVVATKSITDDLKIIVYYHGPGRSAERHRFTQQKFHYCYKIRDQYTEVLIEDLSELDYLIDCSLSGLCLSVFSNQSTYLFYRLVLQSIRPTKYEANDLSTESIRNCYMKSSKEKLEFFGEKATTLMNGVCVQHAVLSCMHFNVCKYTLFFSEKIHPPASRSSIPDRLQVLEKVGETQKKCWRKKELPKDICDQEMDGEFIELFLQFITDHANDVQKLGLDKNELKHQINNLPQKISLEKLMSSTSTSTSVFEDGKYEVKTTENFLEVAVLQSRPEMSKAKGDLMLALMYMQMNEVPHMKFFPKPQQQGAREIFIVSPVAKSCLGIVEQIFSAIASSSKHEMLSQPKKKEARVIQICQSFKQSRARRESCILTSMDFKQWNNYFHLPLFEAILTAFQSIVGNNNLTNFGRCTMEWFYLKMLVLTPDVINDILRAKNKATYDPSEFQDYKRRYPNCVDMFEFIQQKFPKGQETQEGGFPLRFNRGFGQGLLSVTSSLFCTFILRFILLSLKKNNEVVSFDFAQTSDDVLLFVQGKMTHKKLIDTLATLLGKFGLQLSKPKCLEAYYNYDLEDDKVEGPKMVAFFNSTYYSLSGQVKKVSDYFRHLRNTTIPQKNPDNQQRAQTMRKSLHDLKQDLVLDQILNLAKAQQVCTLARTGQVLQPEQYTEVNKSFGSCPLVLTCGSSDYRLDNGNCGNPVFLDLLQVAASDMTADQKKLAKQRILGMIKEKNLSRLTYKTAKHKKKDLKSKVLQSCLRVLQRVHTSQLSSLKSVISLRSRFNSSAEPQLTNEQMAITYLKPKIQSGTQLVQPHLLQRPPVEMSVEQIDAVILSTDFVERYAAAIKEEKKVIDKIVLITPEKNPKRDSQKIVMNRLLQYLMFAQVDLLYIKRIHYDQIIQIVSQGVDMHAEQIIDSFLIRDLVVSATLKTCDNTFSRRTFRDPVMHPRIKESVWSYMTRARALATWVMAQREVEGGYAGYGVRFIESKGKQYYVVVRDTNVHIILCRQGNKLAEAELNLDGTELSDYPMTMKATYDESKLALEDILFVGSKDQRYHWQGTKQKKGIKDYYSSDFQKIYGEPMFKSFEPLTTEVQHQPHQKNGLVLRMQEKMESNDEFAREQHFTMCQAYLGVPDEAKHMCQKSSENQKYLLFEAQCDGAKATVQAIYERNWDLFPRGTFTDRWRKKTYEPFLKDKKKERFTVATHAYKYMLIACIFALRDPPERKELDEIHKQIKNMRDDSIIFMMIRPILSMAGLRHMIRDDNSDFVQLAQPKERTEDELVEMLENIYTHEDRLIEYEAYGEEY